MDNFKQPREYSKLEEEAVDWLVRLDSDSGLSETEKMELRWHFKCRGFQPCRCAIPFLKGGQFSIFFV